LFVFEEPRAPPFVPARLRVEWLCGHATNPVARLDFA
jgi:hypothetical protein